LKGGALAGEVLPWFFMCLSVNVAACVGLYLLVWREPAFVPNTTPQDVALRTLEEDLPTSSGVA